MRSEEKQQQRRRWWPIWLAYAVLLTVGIPWYWPARSTAAWLGLPAWVVVAVAASVAASTLTAGVLLRRWPGESHAEEPPW